MRKVITVLVLLFLVSCDSVKLTNEEVLELCKKADLFENCFFEITKRTMSNWEDHDKSVEILNRLKNEGLITTNHYQERLNYFTYIDVVAFEPTQKAIEEYEFKNSSSGFIWQKAQVLFSKGEITEILGISLSEDKKEAVALIRIEFINTPFSNLKGKRHVPYGCNNYSYIEKEIKLTKYDTGWRVNKQ